MNKTKEEKQREWWLQNLPRMGIDPYKKKKDKLYFGVGKVSKDKANK